MICTFSLRFFYHLQFIFIIICIFFGHLKYPLSLFHMHIIFSSQGNRRKALTGRRKGLCKNLT